MATNDGNVTNNPVILTGEQFATLLQNLREPVRNVQGTSVTGNFVKCTSRFDGDKNTDVNAFIDAIQTYRECTNISEEHALVGLPMLLTDFAATWWRGVKHTVETWENAIELMRHTFGPQKPPYRVYRELFAKEQDEHTPTDVFVCRARALLAHLPRDTLTEETQLDMIYSLLSRSLRKEISRKNFNTFAELLDIARAVEENQVEIFHTSSTVDKQSEIKTTFNKSSKPRCKYCKIFGHATEECRRLSTKTEKEIATTGRKEKHETDRKEHSPTMQKRLIPIVTCFGCGNPGFVRRECPKCNAGKSHNADKLEFNLIDADSIRNEPRDRPIIDIEIRGAKGTGFIDTAARGSVAGCSLYKLLLKKQTAFQSSTVSVALADGQRRNRQVLTTKVDVLIMDKVVPTSFMVFPEATNNYTLLGMDFIENAGIVLNIPQRRWHFSGDEVRHPLRFEEYKGQGDEVIINSLQTMRDDEGALLSDEQREKLNNLLMTNADIFAEKGEATPFAEHQIDTRDSPPIAVSPYRLPKHKKEILEKEIESMLRDDIIEECESPWAAPIVMVPKKDAGVRVCVDYRRLNEVTKSDPYPMPRIDDLLHSAKRTPYMTTIDLRSGYWQINLTVRDRDKSAFTTPFGTFRFKRMPFGLRNSGATFQRLIDHFRRGLKDIINFAYLDDLIILSTTFERHLEELSMVFDRLRKFKLRANRNKCRFACPQVKFLGHIISEDGIEADPEKISAVANMLPPNNVRQLMGFIQTCSWFRRFIPSFSEIAQPLTQLTRKKADWIWGELQQEAFTKLKYALTHVPVLRQADENLPFTIRTDASNYALGAVLLQGESGEERPIEYASKLLSNAQRNYSTTEREALAVVWAVEKFRGYIEGSEVTVASDHQALRWLMGLKSPSGRLARWALTLQAYNLKIVYAPGRVNVVADALSRPTYPIAEETDVNICEVTVDLPQRGARELREEQLSDPEVEKIIRSFESPDHPDLPNWIARGYLMNEGTLYRYVPEEDSEEAQWVVPKCTRQRVMAELHDAPTAGHYGAERTLKRIASNYYWPGMRKFVEEYVKGCVECQKYKATNQKPSGLLRTPASCQRFETVAIDLFGPLPTSRDGYRWVFIIEDIATKWVEIFPLKDATAEACAQKFINEIVLRYGTPRRVISDNGVQFIGAVMQQTAYCLGFDQILNPVYHPEANPVERKNRDMKTQLAILVGSDHRDWPDKLPSIRFAMNSCWTEATGHTAAYLTFGRELRTPGEVQQDLRGVICSENFVPEITPYLLKIADTMKEVRDVHEKEQDKRKRYVDEKRKDLPAFQEGQLVLVRSRVLSDAAKGITSKFHAKRDGPYKILERKSPTTYIVSGIDSDVPIAKYHASDLTAYVEREGGRIVTPIIPLRRRGRPKKIKLPTKATEARMDARARFPSRGGACNECPSERQLDTALEEPRRSERLRGLREIPENSFSDSGTT